jgi:hypothetical protein
MFLDASLSDRRSFKKGKIKIKMKIIKKNENKI